jgi:adenine phosphoribosyltransferase
VRKPGKLPWKARRASYSLEYGTGTLEVHEDAVRPGDRVLVVDDVIATGGTAKASAELVEGLGARVLALLFLVELGFLDGRARLPGRDVRALVRY